MVGASNHIVTRNDTSNHCHMALDPMQARLEDELKPLAIVLGEIEKRLAAGDQIPDFGTLGTWAAGVAERSAAGKPDGRRRDQAAEIRIQMEGEA